MQPFTTVTGIAGPLLRANVDTDIIIRINRLIEHPQGELGPYCFEAIRYAADGSEEPGFPLNKPAFRGAGILVAGENFACGSSREAAVWALLDYGIRCVIAPSFSDIFQSNSYQNGLLPVVLPAAVVGEIAAELEAADEPVMTVDLVSQSVTTPSGRSIAFEMDAERRAGLLQGLDDIGMTLHRHGDALAAFDQQDRIARPWLHAATEKSMKKLLVLPGDGIGTEVTAEVRRIAEWFGQKRGLAFRIEEEAFGMPAWRKHGTLMPESTWEKITHADAILFGAIGSPEYEQIPPEHRKVDYLLRMRKELDLFINLRPIKLFDELVDASTLKPEVIRGADMVLVRELSGGIYFGEPRGIGTNARHERQATNTLVYSEPEIERIARAAFELARTRVGRVCSVDKANVLETGALWRQVVQSLRDREYPDIELTHLYVDNAAMQLIRAPKQFDVMVTENLFGDILSDCAAMVAGSLGLLPSASLCGPDEDGRYAHALYEPIHGSAPDIAGKGIANPVGAIMSFALCLRLTFGLPYEAERLETAVRRAIAAGARTADIAAGGPALSTRAMGDAILGQLELSLGST